MNNNIYFIRHGQTNWNLNKQVQGRSDIQLNYLGIYQAYISAYKFLDAKFDVIYSSPLVRAHKTAQLYNIVTRKNLPLFVHDLLIERSFGELEGQIFNINNFTSDDSYFIKNYPSFEPNVVLQKRAHEFLKHIAVKHPNENVVCFTHSHFIKAILEISHDNNYSYHSEIENCCGVHVKLDQEKIYVKALNI